MTGTIAEAWRCYAERVLPSDAPDVQRVECRRAFYGGCAAYILALMALDRCPEVTTDDLKLISELHEEVKKFGADVEAGKA